MPSWLPSGVLFSCHDVFPLWSESLTLEIEESVTLGVPASSEAVNEACLFSYFCFFSAAGLHELVVHRRTGKIFRPLRADSRRSFGRRVLPGPSQRTTGR